MAGKLTLAMASSKTGCCRVEMAPLHEWKWGAAFTTWGKCRSDFYRSHLHNERMALVQRHRL